MKKVVSSQYSVALWITVVLLFSTMQGCLIIPVPHTRLHAYGVKGRIVDEDGKPIVNASVVNEQAPKKKAISDVDGYFKLSPVRGWHGAYFIGPISLSMFPGFDVPSSLVDVYVNADGFSKQKFTFDYHDNRGKDWQEYHRQEHHRQEFYDYIVVEKIVLHRQDK